MKKFVIFALFIFIIVLSQKWIFSKIYSSKADKMLANNIENAVYIISRDGITDYSANFTIPNIETICYAGGYYSYSVDEILNDVYPNYKYATYLQLKKQFKRGKSESLFMLISKDNLIPIFLSADYYNIRFSDTLKPFKNMDVCYSTANNKLSMDITKQSDQRTEWDSRKVDIALITLK